MGWEDLPDLHKENKQTNKQTQRKEKKKSFFSCRDKARKGLGLGIDVEWGLEMD